MKTRHCVLLAAVAVGAIALVACRDGGDRQGPATQDGGTVAANDGDPGQDAPMTGARPGAAQTTPANTPANAAANSPADTRAQSDVAAGLDERGALGVLSAINEHEIAAGRQALEKGVSGEIAEYAQLMIDEHSDNQRKTRALGPGPDTAARDAVAQREKGERALAELGRKDDDAYAQAYVEAMIKDHAEALELLDDRLIPAADDAEVRAHLTTTRDHVAKHLERARALQTDRSR